jgi:hypothetical protein
MTEETTASTPTPTTIEEYLFKLIEEMYGEECSREDTEELRDKLRPVLSDMAAEFYTRGYKKALEFVREHRSDYDYDSKTVEGLK